MTSQRDIYAYLRSIDRATRKGGSQFNWAQQLAKLFPRAELQRAERTLQARQTKRTSRATERQLALVTKAKRITYLPLQRRWQ